MESIEDCASFMQRAAISRADVAAVRAAGFKDGEVVEIMAHVSLNLFTNYVNMAFNVPVDFPKIVLKSL